MSDENNVVPFPQDPDDEKARRVIAEAQRLARLPRDDWQAQLSDCAKSLDIEQGELAKAQRRRQPCSHGSTVPMER